MLGNDNQNFIVIT